MPSGSLTCPDRGNIILAGAWSPGLRSMCDPVRIASRIHLRHHEDFFTQRSLRSLVHGPAANGFSIQRPRCMCFTKTELAVNFPRCGATFLVWLHLRTPRHSGV